MGVAPRYGIDARWLDVGPPSGRNYVRHVVAELGRGQDAADFVVFVRRQRTGQASRDGVLLPTIEIPDMPALFFNGLGIPMRTPREVVAVAYQHFTPLRSRARRLTIIHDVIYLTSPERFSRLERPYLGLIARLLPRAEVVAAVSQHVRDQVLDRWPKRDPASVIVAPNGVDARLLSAGALPREEVDESAEAAARGRLGINRPYVLYLGRLNTRKNLPTLIRAFAEAELDDHDLVLAGAPDSTVQDLEAIGRDSKVGGRLRLLGGIADGVLPALLRGADAFAYVSFDEGFGVPPLEAMAFGIPVVCSDIPALRETAGPGGAAFIPADDQEAMAGALRSAVLDESVRAAARARGPVHARRYRWSTTADRIRAGLRLAAQ
ncbi:MAG TPA: glycosyltransferase family 1 protein [Candidatus Dormibacteraeota bacterium]|jgi:glycosyltransferase involved in cell wall biosynthesis|nr:glycosyltransferase family 1 protein [Candidatus Dormibacteraeota bacterium]